MTKQNYRVIFSSGDEHIGHAIKRNVGASLTGKLPIATPDVISSAAGEAARTVAHLWRNMNLRSDELDQAKFDMAEQFAKTKLNDLNKRYRLLPTATKKFVDAYYDSLRIAGYDIQGKTPVRKEKKNKPSLTSPKNT